MSDRVWFFICGLLWIARIYFAEREIARLRERVEVHAERAHLLFDFIELNMPGAVEQAKQMVRERTQWRD